MLLHHGHKQNYKGTRGQEAYNSCITCVQKQFYEGIQGHTHTHSLYTNTSSVYNML